MEGSREEVKLPVGSFVLVGIKIKVIESLWVVYFGSIDRKYLKIYFWTENSLFCTLCISKLKSEFYSEGK